MPGKYDENSSAATYLSNWFIFRSKNLNDDPAHPEAVIEVLDFTKSFQAMDNRIWVIGRRTAGNGLMSVSLVMQNIGSLADAVPYTTIDTVNNVDTGAVPIKFTGLIAGIYRLLILNSGGVWDLHVATSMPPDVCFPGYSLPPVVILP